METNEIRPPMTVAGVALRYGVSDSTVWRLVYEHVLPHFKIRGSVRIPADAVDAYMAKVLVPAK